MSVLKRKILSRVGMIFGIIAFLMMFVIPFFIKSNNKTYAGIYFVIFLVCTAVANITMEKSDKPISLDEEREEKIRQIIK
jgi:hypothetical protein